MHSVEVPRRSAARCAAILLLASMAVAASPATTRRAPHTSGPPGPVPAPAFAGNSGSEGPGRAEPREGVAPAHPSGVRITYVGNEGVLITGGGSRILIDALYGNGVPGYLVHSAETARKLEGGLPPFDGVGLILATHFHADHFDAAAVAAHLTANRKARFVSTVQAVDEMRKLPGWDVLAGRVRGIFPAEGEWERFELGGARVSAISLHHGRGRPIQNLGYVIEMGGRKLIHIGDTTASKDDLAIYRLGAERIDVALLPYWYLTDADFIRAVDVEISPKSIIPIHIPAATAPSGWFAPAATLPGLLEHMAGADPRVVILNGILESRDF